MDLSFSGGALGGLDFQGDSTTAPGGKIGASSVNELRPLEEYLADLEIIAAKTKIKQLTEPPSMRERKIGKFAYLPVELTAELPQRAKLAQMLVKEGFQVLLGNLWSMMHCRWGDLPPGIVLFNSMNAQDAGPIFKADSAGHLTVCAIEETDERMILLDCDHNSSLLIDHIFAPTALVANTLRKLAPGKVHTTGAPGPSHRHPILKDRYGFEHAVQTQLLAWSKPAEEAMPMLREIIRREYLIAGELPCELIPAPASITQALKHIHTRNQYDMPFNLPQAWEDRKSQWNPDPIHEDRFKTTLEQDVECMAQYPVKRLAWNMWALMPGTVH